jgi:hypothetical protein
MNDRFLQIKLRHKEMSVNLSVDPEDWYDPAFVVVNSYKRTLFTINEKVKIVPEQGLTNRLNPRILNEEFKEVNSIPILEVTIALGENDEDEQGTIGTYFTADIDREKREGLLLNLTKDSIKLIKDWGIVQVHFQYKERTRNKEDDEMRYGSCYFIVAGNENKFGSLNIDLGSEATQMAYIPPSKKPSKKSLREATNISIIDELKKGYNTLNVEGTNYIQSDKHDKDLYKTGKIIYKREGTLTTSYDDPSCVLALLSDKTFLNPDYFGNFNQANNPMLWKWKTHERNYSGSSDTSNFSTEKKIYKKKIQDNLTMVGNLKLAYLDPEAIEQIKLIGDEIEGFGYTRDRDNLIELIAYIYKILINIGTREMKQGKKALFMRLLLLMPNVYDQDRVNEILRSLNKKFNKEFTEYYMHHSEASQPIETPLVIESFAISESDASLIGYLRNNYLWVGDERIDMEIKDRFLIIDAGRGTIDYSVLDYNGKRSYSCVDRGGMAGAGQYMTNIFMKAVGSLFTQKYGNPKKYLQFIQRVDMMQALVLEEFFESLKMNYSTENKYIENEDFFQEFLLQIHKSDDIQAIAALQKSFNEVKEGDTWPFTLRTTKDFIEEQTSRLVNKFIDNLTVGKEDKNIKGIRYIVLSGRAMNFKPFYTQLKAALQAKVSYKTKTSGLFSKSKTTIPVTFPNLLGEIDLKKRAINIQRITNFSINANSNLLITFDNESESDSLFLGVDIDKKQLKRFNYSYELPDTSLEDRKADDEINGIYYLGMQSYKSFLLRSDAKKFYEVEAQNKSDYELIDDFLKETLFGPGQELKSNTKIYHRFLKQISHLGVAENVDTEEDTKKEIIATEETIETTQLEEDAQEISEEINSNIINPFEEDIIIAEEEKQDEVEESNDKNVEEENDQKKDDDDDKKNDNDKKSSSDLLGD